MKKERHMEETKKELKQKLQDLEQRNTHFQENRDRYNRILKILFEKNPLTILEKLDLCFEIYESVRIKRKKQNGKWVYTFETPIRMGWSSFDEETLEAGLDKLLSKN